MIYKSVYYLLGVEEGVVVDALDEQDAEDGEEEDLEEVEELLEDEGGQALALVVLVDAREELVQVVDVAPAR
jgi:hypothetical protein